MVYYDLENKKASPFQRELAVKITCPAAAALSSTYLAWIHPQRDQTLERFKELQMAIAFVQNKVNKKELAGQEKEILSLLSDYAKTLRIIEQHDAGTLKSPKGKKAKYIVSYDDCQKIIEDVKRDLILKQEASDLFGREINRNFDSIVKNLYQTFDRKELYPTLESKAAHLLYLTIKGEK